MKIKSISIKNLFEIFNYDIAFKSDENVLLITGPNGFGKTMILNIIFNLFNKRFIFFQTLIFDEIIVELEEDIRIVITKYETKVLFTFYRNNQALVTLEYWNQLDSDSERFINQRLGFFKVDSNKWTNLQADVILTPNELLTRYGDSIPYRFITNSLIENNPEINSILDSIQVHLIKEQRLLKRELTTQLPYREDGQRQTVTTDTIQIYADELKELIQENIQKSFSQTQELDSSYLDRLIDEKGRITEADYTSRLKTLNVKQEKLMKLGLYESKQKMRGFSQDDAKALLVYINDLEKKLVIFDDLLQKLELFTTILNERRFTFKTINISKEQGFYFKTSNDKIIRLDQLSSGEQHEVVLLYELIFNVQPNTLVLIDEPEISLHITWQKEFLNDLLKIIQIQKTQVIVATHAPSIINGRWDLVYNLETTKQHD